MHFCHRGLATERYHRVDFCEPGVSQRGQSLGQLLLALIEFTRGHRHDSADNVAQGFDGQARNVHVGDNRRFLFDERGHRLRPCGSVESLAVDWS